MKQPWFIEQQTWLIEHTTRPTLRNLLNLQTVTCARDGAPSMCRTYQFPCAAARVAIEVEVAFIRDRAGEEVGAADVTNDSVATSPGRSHRPGDAPIMCLPSTPAAEAQQTNQAQAQQHNAGGLGNWPDDLIQVIVAPGRVLFWRHVGNVAVTDRVASVDL